MKHIPFIIILLLGLLTQYHQVRAQVDAPAIIANDWKLHLKKALADAEKFRQTIAVHNKIKDYNQVRADIAKARNTLKDLTSLKFFDVKDFQGFVKCLGFENPYYNAGGINWSVCGDINAFAEQVLRNGEALDKANTYQRMSSMRVAKKMAAYARMASGEMIDKSGMPGLSNSERLNMMQKAIELWDKAMKLEKQVMLPELAFAQRAHRKALAKVRQERAAYQRAKEAFRRMRINRDAP